MGDRVKGARLKQARQETGLTLEKAAESLGTSFNTIWRYEAEQHRPSGPTLYGLAALYGKPVEWFFGEGQDNSAPATPPVTRPAEDRKLEGIVTEIQSYLRRRDEARATVAVSHSDNGNEPDSEDIELLTEVAAAAGVGAEVYDETAKEKVPFLASWLRTHSIRPADCHIISVRGESMDPTIPHGSSIIVDRSRTEPHEGNVYVLRTEDGVVVKRLKRDDRDRWMIVSDNPNSETWPAAPLNYGSKIIGEVRWMARSL